MQACLADLEGLPSTARRIFYQSRQPAGLTIRPCQWH
ncbi:hypothetical protein LWV33_03265 [Brucella intermedia]